MKKIVDELKNRSIEYDKLENYGFRHKNEKYTFYQNILNDKFQVQIEFENNIIMSKLIENATGEEYILVDVISSQGEYVGKVRDAYYSLLEDVIAHCTISNIFGGEQTKEVISYVREKYGDELEFLWKDTPDCAIWRNKVNQKWYGALMVIRASKLGLDSDEFVDIIDLRYQKDDILNVIDEKYIFPGWHMNKKSWITIKLDDSVDFTRICELVDNSYELSLRK